MIEEWRPLPGTQYIVSSTGRVARVLKGKQQLGYTLFELPTISETGEYKRRSMFAHRAVALAFHGQPPLPNMDAAHDDGNKENNTPQNIIWKTRRDNMLDKRRHGRQPFNEGHHWAKIDMSIARRIRRTFATGHFNKKQIAKMFGVSRTTVRRIISKSKHGGWIEQTSPKPLPRRAR